LSLAHQVIDFSSAANLLASLRDASIDGCVLKKDFTIPQSFAKPQWSENIIHDRSYMFRQIFHGFATRIHRGGDHLESTKDNALVALQSAPGGSKSLSLDLFARLDASVLSEIQRAELPPDHAVVLLTTLKASLPICVTYNAASTLQSGELITFDGALSLACRMVFSCLFTGDFSKFYNRFAFSMRSCDIDKNEIISVCIDALHLAASEVGKSSILLLVDELVKSGPQDDGYKRVFETCSAIGTLLNKWPVAKFNAILSSLSQVALFNVTKESGRPIHWVYMRRPSVEESLRLFAHYKGNVSEEEFRYIQWCCVDCGGHYQSMRCLAEAVDILVGTKKPITYATLRSDMVGKFQKRDIPRDLVSAGLRSQPMLLSAVLANGKSVNKSIADGDLLNLMENPASADSGVEEVIVPLLSPAVLWQWSVGEQVRLDWMISSNRNELLTAFDDQLAGIEKNIARLEIAKNLPTILFELLKLDDAPRGEIYWAMFQRFHAYWEAIYRELNWQSRSLNAFYEHSHISPTFNHVLLEAARKKKPFVKNVKSLREIQPADLLDYIFLFERPSNFPAIDAISFERLTSSQGTKYWFPSLYFVTYSILPRHSRSLLLLSDVTRQLQYLHCLS